MIAIGLECPTLWTRLSISDSRFIMLILLLDILYFADLFANLLNVWHDMFEHLKFISVICLLFFFVKQNAWKMRMIFILYLPLFTRTQGISVPSLIRRDT